MTNKKTLCAILAAGKGTRMKSALPKVMHKLAGLPMLSHVIAAATSLSPDQIVVVVGPGMDDVAAVAAPHRTVVQTEQLGTGHALKTALDGLDLAHTDVMVLYGDVPLIRPETIENLRAHHRATGAAITVLAMEPKNPFGYGRLVLDVAGHVQKITEESDATADQKKITLCNSGIMIIAGDHLPGWLASLTNNNAKGEYYLTDLIALAQTSGGRCAYVIGAAGDLDGVNDRVQLAAAHARLQQKLREHHMRAGVTMVDPNTVYLSTDTVLGRDVIIEPNVFFGPGVVVADDVRILANCYLEGVAIKEGARVGPFVRVRPGTEIGKKSKVNNFVELKKTILGERVDISQLCCVVDSDVGSYVNIGAGTITSNYDGINKFRTQVGDRSFIGSNSTLIAPVSIGEGTFVTAGSVITDDVPPEKLAFGRARQVNRDHTEKTRAFSQKKQKDQK